MPTETKADGRQELRLEVRGHEEGITTAILHFPEGDPLVLCTVLSPPYENCTEVQAAFIQLARAVVAHGIEATGGELLSTTVLPAGAPLDVAKH